MSKRHQAVDIENIDLIQRIAEGVLVDRYALQTFKL